MQGKTDFMRVLSRKCDDTGASILSDEFDAAEDSMWEKLTLTDFWQHLELFCAIGRPMPFRHKLRMLVQMPHAVSAYDLMHMFLEEDTVGILTNVRCGSHSPSTVMPLVDSISLALVGCELISSTCC